MINKEEYKKPILDDKEKAYLSAVIKPFKGSTKYITKCSAYGENKAFIKIVVLDKRGNRECAFLPCFKANSMYKGMKADKRYTLEELDL